MPVWAQSWVCVTRQTLGSVEWHCRPQRAPWGLARAPALTAGCPALLSGPAHTTQQALPRSAILILILSAFWGSRGFTRRFEAPNGAGEGREVGRD